MAGPQVEASADAEGTAGSPSSSSSSSSSSLPSQLQQRPALDNLPQDVVSHLLGWLKQSDMISLLQLSKAIRQARLEAVHSLTTEDDGASSYDPQALVRLLQQTTGLHRLKLDMKYSEDLQLHVMQAIGDGNFGLELRSLELVHLSEEMATRLFTHLKDGRLTHLVELTLPDMGRASVIHGPLLAEALEARRNKELPALGRLEGVGHFDVEVLRRIWASFSPDTVTHLEACGVEQLAVLEGYLGEHPRFASLCSIRLETLRGRRMMWRTKSLLEQDSNDAESQKWQLTGVLWALYQGRAPNLQHFELLGWTRTMGPVELLGQAIRDGKLPNLSSLELSSLFRSQDFRVIVDGLRHGLPPDSGLQRLHVGGRYRENETRYLADALAAGGGLSQLKELGFELGVKGWSPVLVALADQAPCASMLTTIDVEHILFSRDGVCALIRGLGANRFPSLTKLVLGNAYACVEDEFQPALLSLKANGSPSRLQELKIFENCPNRGCLAALVPVFEANALPCLVTLEVIGAVGAEEAATMEFVDAWKEHGAHIKLERFSLDVSMSDGESRRFCEALADPAFCPSLRSVLGTPYKAGPPLIGPPLNIGRLRERVSREMVRVSLAARWHKREALAATDVRGPAAAGNAVATNEAESGLDSEQKEGGQDPAAEGAAAIEAAAGLDSEQEQEENGAQMAAASNNAAGTETEAGPEHKHEEIEAQEAAMSNELVATQMNASLEEEQQEEKDTAAQVTACESVASSSTMDMESTVPYGCHVM